MHATKSACEIVCHAIALAHKSRVLRAHFRERNITNEKQNRKQFEQKSHLSMGFCEVRANLRPKSYGPKQIMLALNLN